MRLSNPVAQDERFAQVLERDWHNDILNFVRFHLPHLLALLLLAFLLQRAIAFFVARMLRLADRQVANAQRAAQLRTLAVIVRATSYSILSFIVLLQVLSVFSINLAPLLASAGVVGVGIGLGAQSIFKDMLNGVFILLENQYNVGEWVKLAGLTGQVEDLTLRCTTLRDGDGTLYIIPNSQIATVSNLSRDYAVASLNLSVDASANPDRVVALLTSIANDIRADSAFKDLVIADPAVPGVDKIAGPEITYPIFLRVRPLQKDPVLRELRRRILEAFKKEGIPLGNPSSTLVLEQGRPDPTASPAQQPLASA